MDLKYRKRVTTTIKNEILCEFRKLSDKTRIPQSRLFDEALIDLLAKYNIEVEVTKEND